MGGPERTFNFTRRELHAELDKAYWAGVDLGLDQGRKNALAELRDELASELVDPDCPMCAQRAELDDERAEIRRLRDRIRDLEGQARSHAIRTGRRAYRETAH